MLRRLTLTLVAVAALFGCDALFNTDHLGDGASSSPDAGDDVQDGGGDDATADAGNGCPSGKGQPMVRVGDFCIDSAEVTREQYNTFVNAVGADSGGPVGIAKCAFNKDLTIVDSVGVPAPPPETPAFPAHGVDWCDAKAYCLWAGKDLCGGIGGAEIGSDSATDPKKSQWEKACSKDGTLRFGYSDSYVPGTCVDGEQEIRPANGSCKAGYAGIVDMVGNAAEWIDACDPAGLDFVCALMSGTPDPSAIDSCTTVDVVPGNEPWGNAGVRCCAPAK
jgi:formylglycine-generating enzyme required for sulfatase activity